MEQNKTLPKIALGAWAWGNDGTFGGTHTAESLRPVFDAGMKAGLNLWDTAYAYGMGASEKVLGAFLKDYPRDSVLISDKFTPQCADPNAENAVTALYETSARLLGTDYMDFYWIHNPMDAPKWTEKLIPLAKSGKIGAIGLSNHNLAEIQEAAAILEKEGLHISAIQNHFSLLNRSSETSGILDYCRERNITFFAYMVLEQGALSGKYDTQHPFPEGSDRAKVYNPMLPQLEKLNAALKEIAARYQRQLEGYFGGDMNRVSRMAIIWGGEVRMANLCVCACSAVNGVSALHSDILKRDVFHDAYLRQPDQFKNVTNGIDHRRWLAQCNPGLHALVCDVLGSDRYLLHPEELAGLERAADDPAVLARLEEIKALNKQRLAAWVFRTDGFSLNSDAILDVQVKRLHEYKRQLLCAMRITQLQLMLHDDPDQPFQPRTFLFAAKAAPGYATAKRIIQLLCSLAADVNADPVCRGKLQVYFLPNYRVSAAEMLMPAAQVSEQISTAGKEASGTGNMKLMMNGAVTIGTLDGANVEMFEQLGTDNMFLFGLHADEAEALRAAGYDPQAYVRRSPWLGRVLERMSRGYADGESYADLVSSLLYGGDPYLLLADFDDYAATHERLYAAIADPAARARLSLVNIARSGIFAADRAVREYAERIWEVHA